MSRGLNGAAALVCGCLFLFAAPSRAVLTPEEASWNQPVKAFKIVGNLYYVGASGITS